MKVADSGKDKIQKICNTLRNETLAPAKQEAKEIVENAHLHAEQIIEDAKRKAHEMFQSLEKEMEEKRRVFQASMNLACRQAIEDLKQKIESQLFSPQLNQIVKTEMKDPHVISKLLTAFVSYIEKNGIDGDISVIIPKDIDPRSVSSLLSSKVMEKLKDPIEMGQFDGGLLIKLKGEKITVDVTDSVVRELIGSYIRRDLRELVFNV
jgi:V/A-type H+-transporting ATPase subunit E